MGGPTHNGLERLWEVQVAIWTDAIANSTGRDYSRGSKEVLANILPLGSWKIMLPGDIKRRADCCYKYEGSTYPSLLVEVAWSQSRKGLNRKAEEYIYKSDGGIRTSVGIDLSGTFREWGRIKKWKQDGNNRGPAQIIVWRAKRDGKGALQIVESPAIEVCRDDRTSDLTQVECVNLRDFVSKEAEGMMSANELHDLESVGMRMDSSKIRKTIDRVLKEQKDADEKEQKVDDVVVAELLKQAVNRTKQKKKKALGGVNRESSTRSISTTVTRLVEVAGRHLCKLPGRRDSPTDS